MIENQFLTETHCHTAAGSACGKIEPEAQADYYRKMGYDTVFITEHFPINKRAFGMEDSTFEERVKKMCSGYQRARARGNEIGLTVLFAFEFGFRGTDVLTYGLGEDFLLAHPEIEGMDPVDFANLAHEAGGFLVHAHPYREASYIKLIRLFPRSVDAVEIFNASFRDETGNELAARYAEAYGLPPSSGSDNHTGKKWRYGGLLTDRKIECWEDLAQAIRSRGARLYRKLDEELNP